MQYDPKFCLEKEGEGIKLKHDHAYYYQVSCFSVFLYKKLYLTYYYKQVQCHLFCSNMSYCDFVLWTNEDLHIERIYPDESFWLESVDCAKLFFDTSIIVELLGKFIHEQPSQPFMYQLKPRVVNRQVLIRRVLRVRRSTKTLYSSIATARAQKEGDMVGCDNLSCSFQWFHLKCLKLKSFPQCKSWYC